MLGTGLISSGNMTCHVEEFKVRGKTFSASRQGTSSPIERNHANQCSVLTSKFWTAVTGAF